jgi:hypothetical protein
VDNQHLAWNEGMQQAINELKMNTIRRSGYIVEETEGWVASNPEVAGDLK